MKNFGNPDNFKNQIQYTKELIKDSYSRSKINSLNPIILDHYMFDVKSLINLLREDVRRNSILPTMNKYFPQVNNFYL